MPGIPINTWMCIEPEGMDGFLGLRARATRKDFKDDGAISIFLQQLSVNRAGDSFFLSPLPRPRPFPRPSPVLPSRVV